MQQIAIAAWVVACCWPLTAQETADGPTLTIGSQAPQLDIAHWLSEGNGRFKPVTNFQPGHIYVVEFWATWCAPCVAGMPHLAELQTKYSDKNVQVIGVSDEPESKVQEFLKSKLANDDDSPSYEQITASYFLTTDPDRSVYEDYMTAAGFTGIPNAFMVGKSGLIEWIGHPMDIDAPLQQVIDDQWNRDAFLAEFKAKQEEHFFSASVFNLAFAGELKEAAALIAKARLEAGNDDSKLQSIRYMEYAALSSGAERMLLNGKELDYLLGELVVIANSSEPSQEMKIGLIEGELLLAKASSDASRFDQADKVMHALAETEGIEPQILNKLAWKVWELSQEKIEVPAKVIASATDIAEIAVKLAPERCTTIDTLAHLIYMQGDIDRAIELQSQAVEKADADNKKELEKFLDELKTEKSKSGK